MSEVVSVSTEIGGIIVKTKRCAKCTKIKPITDFGSSKRKLKNGEYKEYPYSYCKVCNSEGGKEYYKSVKKKGLRFVYRLVNSRGEIVYIGKTESLPNRTNQHFSKSTHIYSKMEGEDSLTVEYIATKSTCSMLLMELYYINRYKPKYNSDYNTDEPTIRISEFESNKWTRYEKYSEIVVKGNMVLNGDYYRVMSVFKRKRGHKYYVCAEVDLGGGRTKQIPQGSYWTEDEADEVIFKIKESLK